jgi:hypothetical protein
MFENRKMFAVFRLWIIICDVKHSKGVRVGGVMLKIDICSFAYV